MAKEATLLAAERLHTPQELYNNQIRKYEKGNHTHLNISYL
jgi:hypothetical protein